MRSSDEYISDLKKMRDNVFVGGERISRANEMIRPGINVMCTTFDMAADPEYEDLMTAESHPVKG